MAESWTIAFGRYLRTLRERRGLSLDEVESLSEAFPDPIRKAYLSKCENGHQSPAFSKLVALCRIYEVPAEVLVERLQLDMELEKTDAPNTTGQSFDDLVVAGFEALREGFGWRAYALVRDALPASQIAAVNERYGSRLEQVLVTHMNCATVACRLGRLRFPLHEYTYVASTGAMGPRLSVIVRERIAQCHRRLGQLPEAKKELDTAIELAERNCDEHALGYCYASRALVASDEGQTELAGEFHEKAYSCFRNSELRHECARTLSNLAQCYLDSNRNSAARRAASESLRIANELGYRKIQALAKILLGEVELRQGRASSAINSLQDAAAIAEELDDRVLWFKAEFQLFKYALSTGATDDAHRLHRQLSQLKAWIPTDTPELAELAETQF